MGRPLLTYSKHRMGGIVEQNQMKRLRKEHDDVEAAASAARQAYLAQLQSEAASATSQQALIKSLTVQVRAMVGM